MTLMNWKDSLLLLHTNEMIFVAFVVREASIAPRPINVKTAGKIDACILRIVVSAACLFVAIMTKL